MLKYIKLADLLSSIILQKKQLKALVYHNEIRGMAVSAAYSLLSSVINNLHKFEQSLDNIEADSGETLNNKFLAYVMMAELTNTGKVIGGGKIKNLLVKYKHLLPCIDSQSKINKKIVQIRLRQHSQDFEQLKDCLQNQYKAEESSIISNLFQLPYQQYSQLSKSQHFHILQSDACVMQSFSSALPVTLLLQGVSTKWKNRPFHVIDACSAPGNKTIQLAQAITDQRIVFAFQKNHQRFQLLNDTINKYKIQNIRSKHGDFLKIVASNKKYKKVKLILLDPSCSGSGMLTNFSRDEAISENSLEKQLSQTFEDFCLRKEGELQNKEQERINNLHNFQIQLLEHAATFMPRRISYSTCSIYPTENEKVIGKFLQTHPDYTIKRCFKQQTNLNIHPGFGEEFQNCVRVDPRRQETDGFFVCILCRRNMIQTNHD